MNKISFALGTFASNLNWVKAMAILIMAPAVGFASGGSIFVQRGTQFKLVGIDDETWDTIRLCGEGVDYYAQAGCLELKKGGPTSNFEKGYNKYSDGRCTLYAKIVTDSHQTGSTDDEFMLEGPTYVVVKVTKGNANCKLSQRNPSQLRNATGIYLP